LPDDAVRPPASQVSGNPPRAGLVLATPERGEGGWDASAPPQGRGLQVCERGTMARSI